MANGTSETINKVDSISYDESAGSVFIVAFSRSMFIPNSFIKLIQSEWEII